MNEARIRVSQSSGRRARPRAYSSPAAALRELCSAPPVTFHDSYQGGHT
jgi:hypothetical protein